VKASIRSGILLSLAATLLTFAVVEGLWRVYLFHFASQEHLAKWGRLTDLPPHVLKYVPHPYTAYALNPRYRSADGLSRHNSLGLRGRELSREKPPGVYRVALLGGSSTYDTEIADDRLTFAAQLERELRETYGREKLEVVNGGVGGYNSWETLVNFQFRILDLDPDLAIVHEATNDVFARLVPPEAYRRDGTGHRRAWTNEPRWWDGSLFLHYLGVQSGFSQRNTLGDRILVRWDEADDLEPNPPVYTKANLENLVALAKHHSVAILLTSWANSPLKGDYVAEPKWRRGFAEHDDASRAVAAENGVPFYDFAAEMPAEPEYWADGAHNNERGARRKAELFAAYVEKTFLSASTTR
jgi:lysophospholipase L1-like esterase